MLSMGCQPKPLSAKYRLYNTVQGNIKMKLAVDCAKEKNVNEKYDLF